MTNQEIIQPILEKYSDYSDALFVDQLAHYYDLLIEWNQKMNLTTITDCVDVAQKHFVDSLLVLQTNWLPKNSQCIDVGTGAGFPGIVLKLARPDIQLTLLDSLQKRIKFLQTVCDELGIEATFLHARAEDAGQNKQYREKFDVALSRAVASAPVLLEYTLPFVRIGGQSICYKGPHARAEFEQAKPVCHLLGATSLNFYEISYPWGERTILSATKGKKTPKIYPRKAGLPAKNPLT